MSAKARSKNSVPSINIPDLIFKIILLLFCLTMVGLLIYAVFISDKELLDRLFQIMVSTGGVSGSFYVYMRWRVIELVIGKVQDSPENISIEIVKQAFSLIPSIKKERGTK